MATSTSSKPLVAEAKMPKVKISNSKMSHINAFAGAFAMFFGVSVIFAAIAAFTKKWSFGIPFLSNFYNNTSEISTLFLSSVFVFAAALIAILTMRKLTDAESVKKAWSRVSGLAIAFMAFFAVEIVAVAIYSLMSLGSKRVDQGAIWLNNFLPLVINLAAACGVFFIARKLAAGKTDMLRIANYLAIGIGAAAIIIAFISGMVSLYSKTSSTSNALDDFNSLMDIFERYSD